MIQFQRSERWIRRMHACPEAVYFDTNILWEEGRSLIHGLMPKVASQAQDFKIPLYVVQLVVDELVSNRKAKVRAFLGNARKKCDFINSQIGEKKVLIQHCDEAQLLGSVEQCCRTQLESLGLRPVPNANPDLNGLIRLAVNKSPPFQDEDRGFKDTIILESILSHAVQENLSEILVVSADKGMKLGAAARGDRGVCLTVVTSLHETSRELEKAMTELAKKTRDEERAQTEDILQRNLDLVFGEARRSPVLASEVKAVDESLREANIERANAIPPVNIAWTDPDEYIRQDTPIGQRISIRFGVDVLHDVTYREKDYLLLECQPTPMPMCEPFMILRKIVWIQKQLLATAEIAEDRRLENLIVLPEEVLYANADDQVSAS